MKDLTIRDLKPDDASEIKSISSQYKDFTAPSSYIIWMLYHTNDSLSKVVINKNSEIVAYLLVIQGNSPNSIFVWQLGICERSTSNPYKRWLIARYLCDYVFKKWKELEIIEVQFSAPKNRRLKFLKKLVKQIFKKNIEEISLLPIPFQNNCEFLYKFSI